MITATMTELYRGRRVTFHASAPHRGGMAHRYTLEGTVSYVERARSFMGTLETWADVVTDDGQAWRIHAGQVVRP